MPSRGAPQSPGVAPEAHSIAPWMCWRYSGSCQARAVVAEGGVERAPAVEVRAPGDRVIVGLRRAVLLDVGALVELGQDVDVLRLGGEVVPLVGAHPVGGNPLHGGVIRVDVLDRRLLELVRAARVVEEQRPAARVRHPVPVAVGVGGRVDADEPLAALQPALERRALGRVEDALAVGVQHHDDLVRAQGRVGELRRVLGERHREVLRRAHRRDRRPCRRRWRRCGGSRSSSRRPARRSAGSVRKRCRRALPRAPRTAARFASLSFSSPSQRTPSRTSISSWSSRSLK